MTYFFGYPVNFYQDASRNTARDATNAYRVFSTFTDGDVSTSRRETHYRLFTYPLYREGDTNQESRISHIFVKTTGVTNYTVSVPTGFGTGSDVTRTLPEHVTTPQGQQVPILHDGKQHDLFALSTPLTVRALDIAFTGSGVRVYSIMLLNLQLSLNADARFTQIVPTLRNRDTAIFEGFQGIRRRWQNQAAWKWEVALGARFRGTESYDALVAFMQKQTQFTFAQEYHRYPERVYPAFFKNEEATLAFISRYKGAGTEIFFEVAEI